MGDRAALLANVLGSPSDDTARLVLADWLEEHEEEAFGQFLRAGVLAAQFRARDRLDDPAYYQLLQTIAELTTVGAPARWLSALGVGQVRLTAGNWMWDNAGDRVTVRIGSSAGVFIRGLLAELEVTLGEWYTLATQALSTWPIERVRVSDVPGLSFQIDGVVDGWRLNGQVRLPRRNVSLTGYTIPAAISPGAVLTHSAAEWAADQFFADRAAMVEGIAKESAAIVTDLMDAAGDRWPRPPRR